MNKSIVRVFGASGKRLFVGDKVMVVADQCDIDEYGPTVCGDGQRGTIDSTCLGMIHGYGSEDALHDVHATLDNGRAVTGYGREFLKLN